jgi:hypothetical protein
MEGPELATHQGRCDGASAIGDHRGPTHRHALARGPSGPSRERGERDVLGVHPELVHALRHGELPGRSDGSRAGGAAPASPDGIGPGVSHGGRCARRRSEGAGSYVRRSRTDGARLDWRVRGEHKEKKTHISCRQNPRHFGGSQTGVCPTIARSYPSRQLVGGQMGNLSKLLWFFFPTGVSTTPNPRVVRGAYRRRDPYPVASIPSIRDDNEAINRRVVNQFVNQFTCTCP